jgi:glycosidase
MEFHINRAVRDEYGLDKTLFSLTGNVILIDFKRTRELAAQCNEKVGAKNGPEEPVRAGDLAAMGLIDEILHYMVALYRKRVKADVFGEALLRIAEKVGTDRSARLLEVFSDIFPPQKVYAGEFSVADYLAARFDGESAAALSLEEIMMLSLANLNPAFKPFRFLFDDGELANRTAYDLAIEELRRYLSLLPAFGADGLSLWDLLRAPALAADTLEGQLKFIMEHWGSYLAPFMARLVTTLDVIKEENKPNWGGGPGPSEVYDYGHLDAEYERFSADQDWMPSCVLIAKSTLVWLYQLSKQYGREIRTLDQIPDEELDTLARRGFTGLWLIGLWERSTASRTIKQWKGNPEAAASAYSLHDYDIAGELGGWDALANLRERCMRRGIRLGSDMVPNHTGLDSRWIMEHPDRFLQLDAPPFPQYRYESGDLSNNSDVVVQIEDHYYNNTDCAVVFHHYDKRSGRHRYIYHGNDGTSMPWNDTAQIDFLNPEAREAVIQTIIGVCRQFPIVRFDAAMTLAKRHIQRLWYPEPGRGGDIASRSEHAISHEEFTRRIPNEFWREVVDRCAVEAPHTLLLAEAFWMMEGYFVRTLGMHRVYNSAFMNMLKKEENDKYRQTIKNTLSFDSEVLKRFVNFMNNPDEETAVAQFGKGDKYFGICTLLVTMPGLPMFGHGQIEGFEEKYGMEYRRSYRDEEPDEGFIGRHEREIFPLMKRRPLFSGASSFFLYDFYNAEGGVNENVYAYTNRCGDEHALVVFNNSYESGAGWINASAVPVPQKDGTTRQDKLAEALSLRYDEQYFTLLHEMRSGLWFLRSSKDLHEHGLFVMLRGYEAQVYLDIRQVCDDEHGYWARLHHELDGRGVENPGDAVEDLAFGPLYAAFNAALTADAENAALAAAIMLFITEVRRTLAEKDAEADIDTAENAHNAKIGKNSNAAKKNADAEKPAPADAETTAKEIAALINLIQKGKNKDLPDAEKAAEPFFARAYLVMTSLRTLFGGKASGEKAAKRARDWHLARKIREAAASLPNFDRNTAAHAAETAIAVLARSTPPKPWTAAGIFTESRDRDRDNDDFRSLLGLNEFDGTVWYNKERFALTLCYAAFYASLEKNAGPAVTRIVSKIMAADKKAEYRLDSLIAQLSSKPKTGRAQKTPSQKTGKRTR